MAITALGVAFTLLAFLLLRTLVGNWYSTSEATARSDQLIVRHKISISFVLYKRMAEQIMTIPGVTRVSALLWFSGYYKNEQARFGQLAVEVDKYFQIYPEYAASPDEMAAFLADRSGAIVGPDLAERYGWKVGDKVTLTGTIFPGTWDLTVRGIYAGADGYNRDWLFMHYERVQPPNGLSHRLAVKAPPGAASRIDGMFANSQTPTKTESELAVRRTWASWSSSIVAAIDMGSLFVLIILVLVLGNGMAMAARESTGEYAAMRAIGYRSKHIVALVMAEGFIVAAIGVAIGLAAIPAVLSGFSKLTEERLGGSWRLELELWSTVAGVLNALLASMLASAWPAWRSGHLPIVVALRRVA
jgi:putative ABC transport system permease protein